MKRRPNVLIYMEILASLLEGPVGPTRLARACNVPYDRLARYVNLLESKGLIRREIGEGHETFHLTQEGYQLHQDMAKAWARFEI